MFFFAYQVSSTIYAQHQLQISIYYARNTSQRSSRFNTFHCHDIIQSRYYTLNIIYNLEKSHTHFKIRSDSSEFNYFVEHKPPRYFPTDKATFSHLIILCCKFTLPHLIQSFFFVRKSVASGTQLLSLQPQCTTHAPLKIVRDHNFRPYNSKFQDPTSVTQPLIII